MSHVIIVKTSSVVFTGASTAAAAAFMGLGVGAAMGLFVYLDREVKSIEAENLRDSINNNLYGIRSEIDGLTAEFKGSFGKDLAALDMTQERLYAAIKGSQCDEVSRLAGKLEALTSEIRTKLALLNLEEREAEHSAIESEGVLRDILSTAPAGPGADELKVKLESAAREQDVRAKARALAELLDGARELEARREAKSLAGQGALAEEVLTAGQVDDMRNEKARAHRIQISRLLSLIRKYDDEAARELEPLAAEAGSEGNVQSLQMMRDTIQLRYGKIKQRTAYSEVSRAALGKMATQLSLYRDTGEIVDEIKELIAEKYIDRKKYEALRQKAATRYLEIEESRQRALAISRNLERLGYATEGGDSDAITERLRLGEIVYLETQWPDYRIMLRLDPSGEMVTRVVRFVGSEREMEEVSDYQRQKDREVATRWCSDYDSFVSMLRAEGVGVDIVIRKSPENESILYVVSGERATRAQVSSRKAGPKGLEMSSEQG